MRDASPLWLTAVAADYAARGVIDDALVQAATAAEVGLVRVESGGQVWWSDETYRLHGRPRWRRVRTLDDLSFGLPQGVADEVRSTYAAALSDADVDLRYTAVGESGEGRDLVLRAIDLGLALVHRAAPRAIDAALVVDVRDHAEATPEPAEPDDVESPEATAATEPEPARTQAAAPEPEPSETEAPELRLVMVTEGAEEPANADAPEPVITDPAAADVDLDLAAAVLSATPDLVLLYDTEHHRFTSMAGNDSEARTVIDHLRHGGSLSDDVHPDDLAILEDWREGIQGFGPGQTSRIDVRLRLADEWRWMEVRASEFRHTVAGSPSQVVVIVRDVNDRIVAGTRVAESERAFREVFDASPVGLAVLDDHGRFTAVNDAFCLLVGHTRDAALATVYEALLHPEDRAAAVISRARRITEGAATLTSSERRLTRGDGSTIWVRVRTSDIDYGGVVRTLVSLEDVTASKATEDRLRHDAMHDELTGLPNRRLITDRLELALSRARRTGARLAVFFIDLDDLKRVNDTHPWQHRAGDVLLTATATAVRETLREADSLGRLGGDEFVAVCEDAGDDETIAEIGERILAAVRRPLTIGSETVSVGASIGIAVTEDDAETAEHLLRRADAAMYMAKSGGGSRVARAETGPLDVSADLDLVGALARNELRLHYRPVVSLTTGAVLGVTTVVRWRHPERGLIPAQELRSAISAGAAALPVVHWCLERAISDVRTVAPARVEHVSVWLSVPGRAALAASTRAAILDAIGGPDGSATTDTAPSIVLDVHEGDVASLTRRNTQNRHLGELLELGPIALGVENFTADLVPVGTLQLVGAASVSFDPDLLAAAADNSSTEQLVRALVSAAAALGVVTVAMDVVSQAQLDLVRSLGIHAAYGDLIGPAAPLDTYADLLHGGRMRLPGSPEVEDGTAIALPEEGYDDSSALTGSAGLGDLLRGEPSFALFDDSAQDDDIDADDDPTDAQIWARLLGPHPGAAAAAGAGGDEGSAATPAPRPARNPAPRSSFPSAQEPEPTTQPEPTASAEPKPAASLPSESVPSGSVPSESVPSGSVPPGPPPAEITIDLTTPSTPRPAASLSRAADEPSESGDIADRVARELGFTLWPVADVREVVGPARGSGGLPPAPPLFLRPRAQQDPR